MLTMLFCDETRDNAKQYWREVDSELSNWYSQGKISKILDKSSYISGVYLSCNIIKNLLR